MELPVEKSWVQPSKQNQSNGTGNAIILYLEPINETFQPKRVTLFEGSSLKIGRMTSKGTTPTETNGYFDSKVLSRNHAEVSYCNNQVFIKDSKSSNGTFINGKRLSAEGKESGPVELKHGDDLEFGVDIINEQEKKLLYRKVAAKVCFLQPGSDICDIGTNGIDHQKAITNGHVSIKKRPSRAPSNAENSLLSMLETELERARAETRYLSDIGSMLNDATNTIDSKNKRVPFSEKIMDFRLHEESQSKFEETQMKLKEAEAELDQAIIFQEMYKEKYIIADKKLSELREKYISSIIELEQKCSSYERKIIELEHKYEESNQKAVDLERKFKKSESDIRVLEDALQGTLNSQTKQIKTNQSKDSEERLIKITNELSATQNSLEDALKQLSISQKKCKEFQAYANKYHENTADAERIKKIESRNKSLMEELDKERELRERAESIKDQLEIKVKEEMRRMNSSQGGLLWRGHKKQESEPVKECEMTNERSLTDSIIPKDKKFDFDYERSLLIKGSIGIIVIGIGAWCLAKFYPS